MSTCLVTGDANFDLFVKVASSRFCIVKPLLLLLQTVSSLL